MKRNPEKILNSLTQHSSDLEYKFERLYRILFNDEMYYIAYQHIYAKQGNMTKGVDGKTVDGFSVSHIEQLIDTLKNETYQPKPSQRVYIPKKNGKKRPLGIPSFTDKLLQEVVRMILEAIYEGSFEYTSHGFRPQRSPQTALSSIQRSFNGTKWFIEGDIKGFFDHINHEILIAILSERISDERFLRLIRKFLNAGYIEDQVFHKSYSGTPQGGIISPILANIYLDKFDKYIKAYIKHFNKGKRRKENPIVKRLGQRKAKLVAELRNTVDETTRPGQPHQIKTTSPIDLRRGTVIKTTSPRDLRRGTEIKNTSPRDHRRGTVIKNTSPGVLRRGTEISQTRGFDLMRLPCVSSEKHA